MPSMSCKKRWFVGSLSRNDHINAVELTSQLVARAKTTNTGNLVVCKPITRGSSAERDGCAPQS